MRVGGRGSTSGRGWDGGRRHGRRPQGRPGSLAVSLVLGLVLVSQPMPAAAQPAPAERSLTFAEVATVALRDSLQLRAAAFEVAVAQAQLAQARAGRGPQLTVTGSYTRIQERPGQQMTIPNPFGDPPTVTITLPPPDPNVLAVRVALQYPLYTGGRLEAQVALAEANLRGAEAVFARVQQQVVSAAQQLYLRGLAAQANLRAAANALAQAEEGLRVARARERAGVAARVDVVQAEVAVAGARQGVARADATVRSVEAELNAALNLPLSTPLRLTEALVPRPVSITLEAAVPRALEARPELRELRARQDAARAAIELARSGARPNVTAAVNYDVGGGGLTNLSGAWSVTFAVTLLLSDGGVTRERVREAELRLEQLGVQEAQVRQRIELEVRQAFLALRQAAVQIEAAQQGVEQAREALRLARVRYEAGVGTVLEVLAAQTALAQAEAQHAAALFEQNQARLALLLAMGGAF